MSAADILNLARPPRRGSSGRLGSIVAAGSIAASAGCFYLEPINQRPSLDIRPTSSDSVFRGAMVTLEAIVNDPEDDVVAVQWRVYACTDALLVPSCDLDPLFSGVEPQATFLVPLFRADPDGDGPDPGLPVESLRVVLEGRDERGAATRPDQELILPVLNHPPTVTLRAEARFGGVVTTPIEIYARYGDPDDRPENVTLEWTAFSPTQSPGALVDVAVPPDGDAAHLQQGKGFTPLVDGNWEIVVTAADGLGARAEARLIVPVKPDGPPCLDAWAPAAAAQPTPITEPTLFQVQKVRDDLDAFPRTSAAMFFGEAEFAWSIKVGAGPRAPLSNPSNALALDPQTYAPGTVIELRVEVFDRKQIPIPCADSAPTCSVISQPACIQRQTWRVEAR